MAFLTRSTKCFRIVLAISKNSSLANTSIYNAYCTDIQSNPFESTKPVPTVKETISITESLNAINENIRKYRRVFRSDVDVLIKCINEHETLDSDQALSTLKCFGHVLIEETPDVRIKLVQDMWNLIRSRKVLITADHYNSLMASYIENGIDFEPEEFFKQLRYNNLYPNRNTYQLAILKYSKTGDVDNINKMMQTMDTTNVEFNIQIYNSIILAYGYAGKFEAAHGFVDKLKASGLAPVTVTYRNLVLPHARNGAIDNIVSTLDRYQNEEIQLNDRDILSIIYELTIHGHGNCIDRIFPYLAFKHGYNAEAQACILRLMHRNFDSVAFTILKSMMPKEIPGGKVLDDGRFYLRQLLKLKRPMDQICEICDKFIEHGISKNPIGTLITAAATLRSEDLGMEVMRELKARKVPINSDHFRGIFKQISNANDVIRILNIMRYEFDLYPDFNLLRGYVIAAFGSASSQEIIGYLREGGVSKTTAVVAVTLTILRVGKIKEATDLIERYKTGIYTRMFEEDLLSSLIARNDTEYFVKFLRVSYKNMQYIAKDECTFSRAEELGEFIVHTITSLQRIGRPEVIDTVIEHLIKENIRIPIQQVEQIKSIVDPLLALRLIQLIDADHNQVSKSTKTDPRIILLSSYFEVGNYEDYKKLFKQLEMEGVSMPRVSYINLVVLEVTNNNMLTALETFKAGRKIYADLTLNKSQPIANIIEHLYKENSLKEAIEFLDLNRPYQIDGTLNDAYLLPYGKFLYRVAETGNVADLHEIFDKLIELNYIKLTKSISDLDALGPLVKVHLVSGNADKACDTFIRLASHHKCLPLRSELLMYLIEKDDVGNLKRVTDILVKISGFNGGKFSLAIAYMQCGKLAEALNIFSTEITFIFPKTLESTCKHFLKDGRVELIEQFLEVTRSVNYYDKTVVWSSLLDVYYDDTTTERVGNLVKQIKEAGVRVDSGFESKLREFFTERGEEMNVRLPIKKSKSSKTPDNTLETESKRRNEHFKMKFSKFIDEKDITDHDIFNMDRFESYLKIMSSNGNVEKFETMKQKIPNDIRYKSKFDSFVVDAYVKSGRIEEFIDLMTESVKKAIGENEINALARQVPAGKYFDVLKANPSAISKVQELAIELSKRGEHSAINLIWCYHVLDHNDTASYEIWNNFLVKLNKVDFGFIIDAIKTETDEKLAKTLISFLKDHPKLSRNTLGVAYNLLLIKLIKAKRYDETLEVVEESIQNMCFKYVQPMTLERLRSAFRRQGKDFPH